jgi:septum site-determining protein MinC
MTKIAIISQPEQGVLVDIGGCDSLNEATQHLSSTFQVTNEFWENQPVDLNLGKLRLTKDDLTQVLAILSERGVNTRQFFAEEETTRAALRDHNLEPAAPPSTTDALQAAEGLGSWAEAAAAAAAAARTATAGDTAANVATVANVGATGEASAANVGATGEASAANVGATGEAGLDEPSEAQANLARAATVGAGACTTDTAPTETGTDTETSETETEQKPEVKPEPPAPAPAAPVVPHVLYLRQTLRSGQSVSHKGHLVIIGDVNPGAEVSAEGDITIWGALRGIAHAGTAGNTNCEIRALKFDPIQLRIAHSIARAPDRPRGALRSAGPETARIVNGTIRIASSAPD